MTERADLGTESLLLDMLLKTIGRCPSEGTCSANAGCIAKRLQAACVTVSSA